jgi:hypothetical protein
MKLSKNVHTATYLLLFEFILVLNMFPLFFFKKTGSQDSEITAKLTFRGRFLFLERFLIHRGY